MKIANLKEKVTFITSSKVIVARIFNMLYSFTITLLHKFEQKIYPLFFMSQQL